MTTWYAFLAPLGVVIGASIRPICRKIRDWRYGRFEATMKLYLDSLVGKWAVVDLIDRSKDEIRRRLGYDPFRYFELVSKNADLSLKVSYLELKLNKLERDLFADKECPEKAPA